MASDSNDASEILGYRSVAVACAALNSVLWQYATVGHLKVSMLSFIANIGLGFAIAVIAVAPTILIHGLVSCFSPHATRAPRYAQVVSYVVYDIGCLVVGVMIKGT